MSMKTLLLDIETAPLKVYAWGLWNINVSINQIVEPGHTLCWAAKWYGEKTVTFRRIDDPDFLDQIHSMIDEADAVIHFNGTRFDMPTLNNEFLKSGLPRPAPYKQIDLLRVVRKQFRFPSNKLDYVCQYLGLGAKTQHKGMELWTGVMAGNEKDWSVMEKYNKNDVVIMEKLYTKLIPWCDNHPNVGVYVDSDVPLCTKCGSKHLQRRGFYHTATMKYQRFACMTCGSWMRGRVAEGDAASRRHMVTEVR
jgi:hypothetical protein